MPAATCEGRSLSDTDLYEANVQRREKKNKLSFYKTEKSSGRCFHLLIQRRECQLNMMMDGTDLFPSCEHSHDPWFHLRFYSDSPASVPFSVSTFPHAEQLFLFYLRILTRRTIALPVLALQRLTRVLGATNEPPSGHMESTMRAKVTTLVSEKTKPADYFCCAL